MSDFKDLERHLASKKFDLNNKSVSYVSFNFSPFTCPFCIQYLQLQQIIPYVIQNYFPHLPSYSRYLHVVFSPIQLPQWEVLFTRFVYNQIQLVAVLSNQYNFAQLVNYDYYTLQCVDELYKVYYVHKIVYFVNFQLRCLSI